MNLKLKNLNFQNISLDKTKFNLAVSFQHLALGSLVSSFYLYAQQNSVNLIELTWLSLLTAILSFIIEPITSLMADIYGKKLVLLIGYGFLILSFATLIWFEGIWAFALQQIAICFSLSFLSGTEESFLSDISTRNSSSAFDNNTINNFKQKTKPKSDKIVPSKNDENQNLVSDLALMQIFDEVGTILGTFLIGVLATFVGFRLGYTLSLFSAILGFILIFLTASNKNKKHNSIYEISQNLPKTFSFSPLKSLKIFSKNLKHQSWSLFLIALFLFVLGVFRGEETWQISMSEIGINAALIGAIFSVGKLSSLLSSWFIYHLHNKINQRVAIISGFLLQVLAYICFGSRLLKKD
jgi:MFS family permease